MIIETVPQGVFRYIACRVASGEKQKSVAAFFTWAKSWVRFADGGWLQVIIAAAEVFSYVGPVS